jgi:hypothetical protein
MYSSISFGQAPEKNSTMRSRQTGDCKLGCCEADYLRVELAQLCRVDAGRWQHGQLRVAVATSCDDESSPAHMVLVASCQARGDFSACAWRWRARHRFCLCDPRLWSHISASPALSLYGPSGGV